MANYEDDKRLTQIENEEKAAIKESDKMYNGMINEADSYYDEQITAAENWGDKQAEIQQAQTDFTIEKIEQQKDQAHKDYQKEQSGAYVDWQKQSNQYGVNAELQAQNGMAFTGYSESSKVAMYNAYQNRVAVARETYNKAILEFDNMMKDARLQNSAALAQIAYQTLQTTLELSLQGFQYKNSLILEKANAKASISDRYYGRYSDTLSQINQEKAFEEEKRQFDESLEEEKRQFNETMAYNRSKSSGSLGGSGYTGNLGDGDGDGKGDNPYKDWDIDKWHEYIYGIVDTDGKKAAMDEIEEIYNNGWIAQSFKATLGNAVRGRTKDSKDIG